MEHFHSANGSNGLRGNYLYIVLVAGILYSIIIQTPITCCLLLVQHILLLTIRILCLQAHIAHIVHTYM